MESNAGEGLCPAIGPDCVAAPAPLEARTRPTYLTLPVDAEIRFGPGAEKLYALFNYTLSVNLGSDVTGYELSNDINGDKVPRYGGEVSASRSVSQVGFGLGLRSGSDARLPSYVELVPSWSLGRVIGDRSLAQITPLITPGRPVSSG